MIKTKAKDSVEAKGVTEEAYQVDDPIPSRVIIHTNIPFNLVFTFREADIIELLGQCSQTTFKATEDQEGEFVDDVQSKSNEESPELSN